MDNDAIWKIIHAHFEENPQTFVSHHVESYNDFFQKGIFQIFKEKNPIHLRSKFDERLGDYKHQCKLYLGGKDGSKLYFGKPVIHDKDNAHYMYPNEARLRNMTYAMTVHYDVDLEFIYLLSPGETPKNLDAEMLQELVAETKGGGVEFDEDGVFNAGYISDQLEKFAGSNDIHGINTEDTSPESENVDGQENGDEMVGGAKRITREEKQRAPIKMTTQIAAKLREANEKTVASTNRQIYKTSLKNLYLGKFPIMLQSDFCILNGISREMRYTLGECRNDPGGYFIINGKEKTVIVQEKFGDNMLYIQQTDGDDKYTHAAKIRCVSENAAKPVRTLSIMIRRSDDKYRRENVVVNIPNVRAPVPLFIVFRALGILSDREIIDYCLLDREKYAFMEDMFIPSVYDAGNIMTQESALTFISQLTKYHTVAYAHEILTDYFLPHVGETNYIDKAYYLGNIVFRLLCVSAGLEQPTDRDNFKYKRIEVVGSLLYDLFKEYYTMQLKHIYVWLEKALYYSQSMYEEDLHKLVFENYREAFSKRIVDEGFRKAFKGNWGAQEHTKRIGIVQDMNRLSFNSMLSHLRKTNLPMDSSVKLVGPRVLHNSQWGFIDPIDTPDGGNIGLHKSLAIFTYISRGVSREPMIAWMREQLGMKALAELTPLVISTMTKVIINGYWAGVIDDPIGSVRKIRLFRRNALIPIHTSATFHIKHNTVYVYTDAGRVYRPLFYKDDETGKWSFEQSPDMLKKIQSGAITWTELIAGFNERNADIDFKPTYPIMYELSKLYSGVNSGETNPAKYDRFLKNKAVLDYIDPSETEDALISVDVGDFAKQPPTTQRLYTHMELHASNTYGVMCNQIIFPENNPPTRNSFSCGQSKQAVSLYHTNFRLRMDKAAVVLNSGQVPLIKSRYLEYINHEEQPYGENAIVAIMCYTGYNVEDAVLINEGAIQRGLFRTTYYTTYEEHEETTKRGNAVSDKHFTNIEQSPNVVGLKTGYDYSLLDAAGLIRENVQVDDRTVLIGFTGNNPDRPDVRVDMSIKPKKGQLGVVDKSFMTEGEAGERIAKVRIREERIPNLGDKMASRAGQKGTVGLVVPEKDMPYTANGLRPDIIINPHALPTRMTIGQLVECITGKACLAQGGFGDCTAFNNNGSKVAVFGKTLARFGYHSSGNELMYNGMTGEQLESEIFIGPTYYMRLKHMVKDKINYRATGPRTVLTRQPVSGRANDGGLRIGDMERDVLISHGITAFLRESMLDRGDKTYMAVCNNSGMLAICNHDKNLFLSPMVDGPLRFSPSFDGKQLVLENITRFGRDFSVVEIPYALKLFIQELQAANIQLRIITEDNIKHMETLAFSKNMATLTGIPDITPAKLLQRAREAANKVAPNAESPDSLHTPTPVPESQTTVPLFKPESPEGPPPPPLFKPDSPEGPPPPPLQTGGKRHFGVGQPVFYSKSTQLGLNKYKLWRVKSVSSDFDTIETDAPELGDDSVQVVDPMDLREPTVDDYQTMKMEEQAQMQNQMQTQMQNQMIANQQAMIPSAQPGITVSPIIKIVNGPDNSTGGTDAQPQEGEIKIKGGQTYSHPTGNVRSVSTSAEKPVAESSALGGVIDFAKSLFIKKIE